MAGSGRPELTRVAWMLSSSPWSSSMTRMEALSGIDFIMVSEATGYTPDASRSSTFRSRSSIFMGLKNTLLNPSWAASSSLG